MIPSNNVLLSNGLDRPIEVQKPKVNSISILERISTVSSILFELVFLPNRFQVFCRNSVNGAQFMALLTLLMWNDTGLNGKLLIDFQKNKNKNKIEKCTKTIFFFKISL